MTPELILILSLALIIGLSELRERKEERRVQELRDMHKLHTQAVKAELIGMTKTVDFALKEVTNQMHGILSKQDSDGKAAHALITETKAKLEHMHQNFELKTRLADEDGQSFDTIEM